jgi:hypothetical protein
MNAYWHIPKRYRPRVSSEFTKDVAAWVALIFVGVIITVQVVLG